MYITPKIQSFIPVFKKIKYTIEKMLVSSSILFAMGKTIPSHTEIDLILIFKLIFSGINASSNPCSILSKLASCSGDNYCVESSGKAECRLVAIFTLFHIRIWNIPPSLFYVLHTFYVPKILNNIGHIDSAPIF